MKQNNSAIEMLMVCLDQYYRFMERKMRKNICQNLWNSMVVYLTKTIFVAGSEN